MKIIEIMEFKESDIDKIYEIQKAAYKPLYEKYHDDCSNPYMESKETILHKYMREGTRGYVFMKDGSIVGAVRIIFQPESNSGRVSALAVHPQYQGQGIAQHALLEIEKLHSDTNKWYLDTIMQESGNCYLYEKIGYRRTGKIEEINEKMTLVFYEKIV